MRCLDFVEEELLRLKREDLYRELHVLETAQEPEVTIGGKRFLLLSSNNYLGLANRPELKEAAIRAIEDFGVGSGASRLIAGTTLLHRRLEERIARFKGEEDSIVFTSGYQANVGVLSALLQEGDAAIVDRLIHASLVDGCRLSKARLFVYPHRDLDRLESILKRTQGYKKRLIVTDGVFSMEGDVAPLREILYLSEKYGADIFLDDAHGTGVLGKSGRGTLEHLGVQGGMIIQMGTFSKAFGGLGGYVVGPRKVVEFLRNTARSFIYSTSLPPSVLGANIKAIDLVEAGEGLRRRLFENSEVLRQGLKRLGFDLMGSETQIVPVLVRGLGEVIKVSRFLWSEGIFAPCIRPPTVKRDASRIRLSVMATHKKAHLRRVLEVFERVRSKFF